ncbi:hypothetical protein [Marinitoga sp. 38H-ov]|jgi:hypothetical protein|uniref:hypothetical protein n=1 Tax=Marinitoga sp. 38H-ov TaxID=1755814 RepID=UPI0013EA737A|nr:hypothetical protein [Marinitoga sp. 38H-ov]KAF2956807.1 hypothetical protein AS160_04385 [Marinitoga sp. 38H-ov]
MKKFLTALLVGGLMVGSIFAFGGYGYAPMTNQNTNSAPVYQNYRGARGGYMFSEENMITVTGTIDSIEESKDFPGVLEIKIKTENGDIVEIHANSYFASDLEVGKTIEVKGWEVILNDEKIFRPVETKVDGKEVVLNGFRGAVRGTGVAQMPGYNMPVNNFRGNRGNTMNRPTNNFRGNTGYAPNMNYGYGRNKNFRTPKNYQNQMPCYQQPIQPMPRGRR